MLFCYGSPFGFICSLNIFEAKQKENYLSISFSFSIANVLLNHWNDSIQQSRIRYVCVGFSTTGLAQQYTQTGSHTRIHAVYRHVCVFTIFSNTLITLKQNGKIQIILVRFIANTHQILTFNPLAKTHVLTERKCVCV